jgi:hypothetical protein
MHDADPEIPHIFPSPSPLTGEQYRTLVPEQLELIDGYLIDGPKLSDARQRLLAALLANCGLDQAVELAPLHVWEDALDRMYGMDR